MERERDPDLGGTEIPPKFQPKRVHIKTHSNKNGEKLNRISETARER